MPREPYAAGINPPAQRVELLFAPDARDDALIARHLTVAPSTIGIGAQQVAVAVTVITVVVVVVVYTVTVATAPTVTGTVVVTVAAVTVTSASVVDDTTGEMDGA